MRRDVFDFACLGDSLTMGWVEAAWQPHVVARLSMLTPRPVRTYDFGEGGSTAEGGLTRLQPLIDLRPQAALVAFGMNDSAYTTPTMADYAENLRLIIGRIRAGTPGTSIFLMTMNPIATNATTEVQTRHARLPQYYDALRVGARQQRVGLIDNEPQWRGSTTATIPDGVHPIASAVQQITVLNVVAALTPLL
jgi:lysophospholipase L1-like esterase